MRDSSPNSAVGRPQGRRVVFVVRAFPVAPPLQLHILRSEVVTLVTPAIAAPELHSRDARHSTTAAHPHREPSCRGGARTQRTGGEERLHGGAPDRKSGVEGKRGELGGRR